MKLPLVLGAVVATYGCVLVAIFRHAQGLTLTSADDATRLLIAHGFGRHGVLPLHWTWPPLPMLIDGIPIALGGDAIACAAILRAAMMVVTGLLLARFWSAAVHGRGHDGAALPAILAAWLFFPVNLRLALSGLSEPYLYLLSSAGLACWQRGLRRDEARRSESRAAEGPWLLLSGAAFGLAFWARYEAALLIVLFCAAMTLDRGRRAVRLVMVAAAFPAGWLFVQWRVFGDPLQFVHATRDAVRAEAMAFHGLERMPLSRAIEVLRSALWSAPVAALAALGLTRLARSNRRLLAGVLAFAALYGGMAIVSIGGRMEFYLNVFSLVVLPAAVLGAEWLLGAPRPRRWAHAVGGSLR